MGSVDKPKKYWTLLWGAFFALGVLLGLGGDSAIRSSPESYSFSQFGLRPFILDYVGALLWGPICGLFEWLRFGHIRLRKPFWLYSPLESLGTSQFALFAATFLSAIGLTILLATPIVGLATVPFGLDFLGSALFLVVGIRVAILLFGARKPTDNP